MTAPSKIITGIGIAALLGGGFWFLQSGRSEIKFARVTPEQAKKAAEVLARDGDNDGLKDWEEDLWHTDRSKPDTDGDSTLDGEEVRLGRNPAKAGPGDELDKETIEKKTVPGGGDWTETDRLSRELFAKYLSLRQSGAPFTAEDEQKLLEDFLRRYPESKPNKRYAVNDIVLAKDDDLAALRSYGNALGAVIEAHKEAGEGELIIFERALENEDEQDLAGMGKRVKRYESILSGFKAIPSPKSVASIHTDLLNAVETLKESVAGMSLALSDSVRALSSAAAYPSAVDNLTDTLALLATLMKEKGVVFGKSEAGYILTQ